MWPLIFQYMDTMVNTHVVVKSANAASDTTISFMNSEASTKRSKYPKVTIVKYRGLSSRLVNS